MILRIAFLLCVLFMGCKQATVSDTPIPNAHEGFRTYGTKECLDYPWRTNGLQHHGPDVLQIVLDVDFLTVGVIENFGSLVSEQRCLLFSTFDNKEQSAVITAKFDSQAELIRRIIKESPSGMGRVWEIGNEPNLYPYIEPTAYAYLYAKYYKHIKALDSTARVMPGGLFVKEIFPALDYLAKRFGRISGDLKVIYSTAKYYDIFVKATRDLGADIDLCNLHIYPGVMKMTKSLDNALLAIHKKNKEFGISEIWVTETGNINPASILPDDGLIDGMRALLDFYVHNTVNITRWYWFKAEGYDKKFDILGLDGAETALAYHDCILTNLGVLYKTLRDSALAGR